MGLTYKEWASGQDTDSLTITVLEGNKNYRYRLLASNDSGTVTSDEVTISIISSSTATSDTAPVILRQPQSVSTKSGEKVTLKATVRGAASYYWEYSRGDGKWARLGYVDWATGQYTDSLTITVTPARRGYMFRLVASNSKGTVTSTPATITVR